MPDPRFDQLVKIWSPKKVIPAVLSVTDIAGLVKGAHEGAGLGNAFLADITACDAIFHVVRVFRDAEVTHVDGAVDPVRDLITINNELLQKDLGRITNLVESKRKNVERGIGGKPAKEEFEILEKIQACLSAGTHLRYMKWGPKEIELLNQLQFLTAKTQVVLMNCSAEVFQTKKSASLPKIKAYLDEHMPGAPAIPFSVEWEQKYFDADDEAKAAMVEADKVQSAFPNIIKQGYNALRLMFVDRSPASSSSSCCRPLHGCCRVCLSSCFGGIHGLWVSCSLLPPAHVRRSCCAAVAAAGWVAVVVALSVIGIC